MSALRVQRHRPQLTLADGRFGLEDGVRRMTFMAAQSFGLADRVLRPCVAADFALFAEDTIDRATFADPMQMPQGVTAVWVAREAGVTGGAVTGRLPSRVLGDASQPSLA